MTIQLQRVKYILNTSNIEAEINELKLSVMGDNGMQHEIIEEDGYTVIYMKNNNKITDEKYIFYGRIIEGQLYIARMQYIEPLEFDCPDFYDEFFSNGTELKM